LARARRLVLLAAALTLAATTTGCQPYASAEKETVTLAVSTLHNPFFRQVRAGARQVAEVSGVRLEVVAAGNSAERQAKQLRAAAEDAEAVLVNPVDPQAAESAVRPVLRAGVPVVAVDRTIPEADVASTVISDNVDGGRQAAEALAQALEGSGQVIHLQGIPDTSTSVKRGRGFEEVMAFHEGIDVVARQPAYFDRGSAREVTRRLLQAYPGVDGIFAENDQMALGAVDALGKRAGSEVKVVGFDGIPEALQAIEDGTMTATVSQNPEQIGRTAVEEAVSAIDGGPVAPHVPVGVELVTAGNVGEYL
jgi:ribose transport system substrate-binding protein